ncbi:formate hydrogenlyase complex 3 iron-sulfur protein [Klebsiella pneumoniae]|nr:formate hydrogenlyase complex 3 iron-sulfur protein [Klebsiella pneumoniae]
MFTFIKKVIKTGTATHAYPLEPMPVDKNFRGKPEHTPTAVYRLRGLRERLPVERPDGRDRSGH